MYIKRILSIVIFLTVVLSSSAFASKVVTSPQITKDETYLELRGEYIFDENKNKDGAWKERTIIGHGFTSYWASEIEALVNHPGNDNSGTDITTLEWRNKFQFTTQDNFGLDTGMRLGYIFDATGDNKNTIDARFLAQKDFGKFSHRANLIFDRQIGNASSKGVDAGFSWSSRYKYIDGFQPGFEIYDAFGKIGSGTSYGAQDHRVGPVIYGKFANGISYDAGCLFGVSQGAPDGTLKAIVKYSW